MRTIIERTTDALRVDVCSLYLMDRDGDRLTLAATNGLDPGHVGKVSLAYGEGITGAAAKSRRPIEVLDVRVEPRFKWVRGYDSRASRRCSPFRCHGPAASSRDQRPDARKPALRRGRDGVPRDDRALLGGIIEKGGSRRSAKRSSNR